MLELLYLPCCCDALCGSQRSLLCYRPVLAAAGTSRVGLNSISGPRGAQGLFSKCFCVAVGGGCAVSVGRGYL